jgi:hypothetical protein
MNEVKAIGNPANFAGLSGEHGVHAASTRERKASLGKNSRHPTFERSSGVNAALR